MVQCAIEQWIFFVVTCFAGSANAKTIAKGRPVCDTAQTAPMFAGNLHVHFEFHYISPTCRHTATMQPVIA